MRKSHVFVGSSHPELGQLICNRLGVEPGPCTLRKFSNGETSIEIGLSVRDEDIYIVQSGSPTINDAIMELLTFISGCKGGSAHKITAVLPLFPYSKQSKMKKHRGAITAKMLANLIIMAGADHVITMDLHASQMQGFFSKPVDNLYAGPTLARWIKHNVPDYKEAVIVSKNPGGTKRVTALADALKINFAMIHTDRQRHFGRNSGTASAASTKLPTGSNILAHTLASLSSASRNSPGVSVSVEYAKRELDLINEEPDSRSQMSRIENGSVHDDETQNGETDHRASENEDEAEAEHNGVIHSQEIHVARVVQGHVVDDDYPSPSAGALQSDSDVASELHDSNNITGVAALGGSVDAALSDDEEDEEFEQEKLIALVGDVKGKAAIILDDMIDRPGSFIAAAEHCRLNCGAKCVYVVATHGIFSNGSLEALNECPCIDHIVVTNTYPIPADAQAKCSKLTVIDISGIFAECIRRNHHGESISALFEQLVTI